MLYSCDVTILALGIVEEIFMRKLAVALVLSAWSMVALASGLPWAVDSLEKAQSLAGKGGSRHVLVFYTSPD
jgi:hypothetical protein